MSENNKLSRRGFLQSVGVAGVSAAAVSALPVGMLKAAVPANVLAEEIKLPFTPLEPSTADELVLPEGFSYQVIVKRGDVFTPDGRAFGDNADWVGWYPIDGLEGGSSTEEGLLVINNEYGNMLFVSGYIGGEKTLDQVKLEKEAVGICVIHVKKQDGKWTIIADSDKARRFSGADKLGFSGPAAGSVAVKGATEVFGTLGNCSGGQTPWLTALSGEENFQDYYGEDKNKLGGGYGWYEAGGAENGEIPEHYGWMVEVDPYAGTAKKRTALGRFRHENAAVAVGKSGKVVVYQGDDKRDECVYKFISAVNYDAANRDANLDILDAGTLYVADFGKGKWIPVVFEGNEETLSDPEKVGGYTIASQADVLVYTAQCARALGGTKMDRPEDIEINPVTGDVYIALTNNSNHGNFHGQILRLIEDGADPEALVFQWDVFAVGGSQSGFSSADNLVFDTNGDLWMVTDVSSSSLNKGIYAFMGNNSLFYFPTANAGKAVTPAYRFAAGPVECEMTGPTWVGADTMLLSVQHPGEETEDPAAPTSVWPDGAGEPRTAVVAITGPFNNMGMYNPMYYIAK